MHRAFERAARGALERFGVRATFRPREGASVPIRAILVRDVEPAVPEMQAGVVERRHEVSVLSGQVTPARGDRFEIDGERWDWVRVISDDGYLLTGVVRRAD